MDDSKLVFLVCNLRNKTMRRILIRRSRTCLVGCGVLIFLAIIAIIFPMQTLFPNDSENQTSLSAAARQKRRNYATQMACGLDAQKLHVSNMQYVSLKELMVYGFVVSMHDPDSDRVISKSIQQGLHVRKGTYPSVNEVHEICEHSSELYSIDCGHGSVFVEVGSAFGMVSLYAATRGMKVYAFDPLLPNVQRLKESLCLNGERHWRRQNFENSSLSRCGEPCADWGNFSPSNFFLSQSLVGAQASEEEHIVESEPGNLAATMFGGGSVKSEVPMVTIDQSVNDTHIELMLLTCQGYEYDVSARYFSLQIRLNLTRIHRRCLARLLTSDQAASETSFGGVIMYLRSSTSKLRKSLSF